MCIRICSRLSRHPNSDLIPLTPPSRRPLPPTPSCEQSYDVWNEIYHLAKFMKKCDLWADTFKDAFHWVHDNDPDAKLCINE